MFVLASHEVEVHQSLDLKEKSLRPQRITYAAVYHSQQVTEPSHRQGSQEIESAFSGDLPFQGKQ